MPPQMQFQYAKKDGTLSSPFAAANAQAALGMLGQFADRDPNSGVLEYKSPGVQQTTTPIRQQAAQDSTTLDNYLAPRDDAAAAEPKGAAKALADFNAAFKDVQDDLERAVGTVKQRALAEVASVESQLDSIRAISSQSTNMLIDSITKTYGARIEMMEDAERRRLAAEKQQGIRTGRARYTAGVQAGILTDVEQKGIARISALEGEMLGKIAEAEQARTDRDVELFTLRMRELDRIQKNLNTEVQGLQKAATDQLETMRKAQEDARKAEREEFDFAVKQAKAYAPALANSLSGFTNPADQAALITEVASRRGIDPMVLWGEVVAEMEAQGKRDLDIRNIESQIAARAAQTEISIFNADTSRMNADTSRYSAETARAREGRLAAGDKPRPSGVSVETENILSGATSIDDLPSAKAEAVKGELRDLGFYSSNPPLWYIEMVNQERRQTVLPEEVRRMWEEYRQGVIASGSI